MKIRNYIHSDLDSVLALSHQFDTSPFTFDNKLYNAESGINPVFAKEMITRSGTHTFVLEVEGELAGFISISMNIPLSKVLGRNIASILLLVVDKKHRNRGMGKYLVSKAIEAMRGSLVDLYTVGTDLYNIPAINSYERNGFTTKLSWHIYRWYSSDISTLDSSNNIDIMAESGFDHYEDLFDRPISLLHEKSVDTAKLKKYLWDMFLAKRHKNEYPIMEYKSDSISKALIHIQLDSLSMKSLNSNKKIYRISDLLIKEEDIFNIGTIILSDLKCRFNDAAYLEIWVKSHDTKKIHLLERNGFELSYSGINLHKHVKN